MPATIDTAKPLDPEQVGEFLNRAVELGKPRREPRQLEDTLAEVAKLGLPPGSPVIIALSNSVRTLRIQFAALLLELVPVMLAPNTPGARVRRLSEIIDAQALVAARPDPRRFGTAGTFPVDGAEAVVFGKPAVEPRFSAGEVLISTSGTSGAASVCLHRVDSLLRNSLRHAGAVGLTGSDTVLVNLPLYYSYGMVAQVLAAFEVGARIVVTGPPFTPSGYTRAVTDHGITHGSLTPELVRRMLAEDTPLPGGSLRVLTVGGDQLDPGHVAWLIGTRPGRELYLTYGLTEAGPRVSTLAAHVEPTRRHASVGLPLPGVEVRVRDADPADGVGELVVQTDTALLGKLGAVSSDRGLIGPGLIATGDLFRIDEDGYLHFRGRISDFALIRGEKVSLAGVRQAALAINGVVRCIPMLRTMGAEAALDLEVTVVNPGRDAEQRIRRALASVLLPAERPREIMVTAAGTDSGFHK
jgi:acyl-CoA synthetase (AMP-forming)/AMP-acid ligase II